KHGGNAVSIRKVADEDADEDGDDQADDHAHQSAEHVGEWSGRQPKVEPPPSSQHVGRAKVGEDQTFEGRQPDARPARVRARDAPDHEITEQKTTDHSEPRPQHAGEILGTHHGLPPQETDSPASAMNTPALMGEEKAADTASATDRTSTTSRPAGRPRPGPRRGHTGAPARPPPPPAPAAPRRAR